MTAVSQPPPAPPVRRPPRARAAVDGLLALNDLDAPAAERRRRFRDALDDAVRAEFLAGRVVIDSPKQSAHLDAVGDLFALASLHADTSGAGEVYSGAFVALPDADVLPDLAFWPADVAAGFRRGQWLFPTPAWVVEVVDEWTEHRDRTDKRSAYEAAGVGELWLHDPFLRRLDVLRLDGGRYVERAASTDADATIGPACLPRFRVPLSALSEREPWLAAVREASAPDPR